MHYTTIYDDLFIAASNTYMPLGWDWRKDKAQCIQESRLEPNAVSSAGAEGIAQFMPATWRDAKKRMPMPADASAFDPKYAIPANAWYMRSLWNEWTNPARDPLDRWKLALASYNCGFGNVEHAQRLAGGAIDYASIIQRLPEVTGDDDAPETIGYVEHILRYYDQLKAA
jgi:soluble lytic murein transglycosylase-like protein